MGPVCQSEGGDVRAGRRGLRGSWAGSVGAERRAWELGRLGRSGVREWAGWGGGLGHGEKRERGSGLGRRVGLLGWVGFPSSFSFLFFFSKLHPNLFEFKLEFEFKPYPINQ